MPPNQPPEDKSKIDELNKSLYSRNAPDVLTRRKLRYSDVNTDVKPAWEREPEPQDEVMLNKVYRDHSMSFLTKLLIFSVLFCIAAVGLGAFLFFNGANLISANNIDIEIHGPVSVPGGTPVTFDITVTNKNNVDLQLADLTVNFPAGTTDPKDPSQELTSYRDLLGDIKAGASVKRTVQAIMFGEENTQKQVLVDVNYGVKGSTSSFTKEQDYDVLLNSSPVNLSLSAFKEITSGQEFDLKINVKSNSQDTLKNVLVNASYPFGYTFLQASLKPLSDNATWKIGDIPPGGSKTIIVHGRLEGENQDNRVFKVTVGAQSSRNANAIGTQYMSADQDIAIKKPFVSLAIALDGKGASDDATAEFNQPVHVDVTWFNNLPTAVSDANITLKLSGSAYDKTLVSPGDGYFHSATDEIVWNPQTTGKLTSIAAGDTGTVSFTITPRDLSTPSRPLGNPTLTFSATVSGKRTQESSVPETLTSVVTRTDKISTRAILSGQVLRNSGAFANVGPIPPKVEQKTTYTILWTVDNTVNAINNAQVTAKLPAGVTWQNLVSPAGEDVTYDKPSGTVTWNVGTVGTYTAQIGQRRQVSFQIGLEPSVSQVGTTPNLIGEASFSGTDDFTGETVTSKQGTLTTRFSTDPSYMEGESNVVR